MSTAKKTSKPKSPKKRTTSAKAKSTSTAAKPAKPQPAPKPKAKKDNVMRQIFISKVVVNMSLGTGGEVLAKAKTILEDSWIRDVSLTFSRWPGFKYRIICT